MGTDITKVCSHVLEVVVAIVPGQFHQCGMGRMLAKCHQGRMETVDANIFLGRKAHVFGEDAVELPWANACFSRQVGQANIHRMVRLDIGKHLHHSVHVDILCAADIGQLLEEKRIRHFGIDRVYRSSFFALTSSLLVLTSYLFALTSYLTQRLLIPNKFLPQLLGRQLPVNELSR